MGDTHYSVLLNESIELLNIKSDGIYVDGTFGRGGHSKAILAKLGKNGRLIAFDKDLEAIEYAKQNILDERLLVVHDSFANLKKYLRSNNIKQIDGLLLDLGVSSPQLDNASRGFSFSKDAKLDMRMDITRGSSLKEWINKVEEPELDQILWRYGEERFHKRIAHQIIKLRSIKPITTTAQLAKIIEDSIPFRDKGQHPATRSFQALRIVINNELNDLEQILDDVPDLLSIYGRVVVISFHSLEDRIVKSKFNELSKAKELPKWVIANNEKDINYKIIAKKVKATDTEINENVRSRSAILRCLEKLK
ncbi:MAG: 16S rRNA (cytosine(1402)-N(4))-methyltransferase RsmH [Neisseriaceae bacterium]